MSDTPADTAFPSPERINPMIVNNEITNTNDLAEEHLAQSGEPDDGPDVQTDMVAMRKPEDRGIEFHVSMRDYTQRDMESLIVEAAARLLVGEYGNNKLAKLIEERCVTLTTSKVDKHLERITSDIIDQPVTPRFSGLSKADEKPVTMRELIGLTGQAYLQERVGLDGKPQGDKWSGKPRIQHLAEDAVSRKFKNEIEKVTNGLIAEIKSAIDAQHKAFIEIEKARFREAMAKVIR